MIRIDEKERAYDQEKELIKIESRENKQDDVR